MITEVGRIVWRMEESTSVAAYWESIHAKRWLYWVPVVGYAALIFFFSSLPNPTRDLPSVFGDFNDKLVHVVEYGIFGILLYRALRWGAGPRWASHAWWIAIIGAMAYGVTDEIHQSFVPPREADALDVVADTVGAMALTTIWRKATESKTSEEQA